MKAPPSTLIARLRALLMPTIRWRQQRDELQFVMDRPIYGNLVAR
ncbi:hypothetical protein [Actinomyces sp. B33]|nr:hypothetical protein [Actinomyces sp. B33]